MFDFFQSIIEYDIPMISPYIKNLTEMILNVKHEMRNKRKNRKNNNFKTKLKFISFKFVTDSNLKNSTRVCAMNFLNCLIEIQKAVIILFSIISFII